MKQVVQNARNGQVRVLDVPAPTPARGRVLVRVQASVVSVGSERAALAFGRRSMLQKARARPDLVRQVVQKAKRDGMRSAYSAATNRLDEPQPLGYACAGTVLALGEGVTGLQVGDRVACAGAGQAVHAEAVSVSANLVVPLPGNVDFESGAFTTLGAIALHATRLAVLRLGETTAVIGLGLVGLLAAQLARAAGCHVLGIDFDPTRCALALNLGCQGTATTAADFQALVERKTGQRGADHVIIAASAPDSQAVELAGEVARDRATVVVLGDVGMDVPRRAYYAKELELKVSRSYGPGRYDADYEEKGRDYPLGYVRWTERRNMEAFAALLAEHKVDVQPLVTHRFPIADAERAYDLISKGKEPHLAVLIGYPEASELSPSLHLRRGPGLPPVHEVAVGLAGAGQFAMNVLIPVIKKAKNAELTAICSATGAKAQSVGKKFRFRFCATDLAQMIEEPEINVIVVATPHHLHARQAADALAAGKHVFLEKPMAVSEEELRELLTACVAVQNRAPEESGPVLMVDYNRRFSPLTEALRRFLAGVQEPLLMRYRVNAGFLPREHWTNDPDIGGGRIVGEVCHFIDLMTHLAGQLPVRVYARTLPDLARYSGDNLAATLEFADGGLGEITYVANGDRGLPKERLEVFGGGLSAVLDDFRRLDTYQDGKRKSVRSRRQEKGHAEAWRAFVGGVSSGEPPIPWRSWWPRVSRRFASKTPSAAAAWRRWR